LKHSLGSARHEYFPNLFVGQHAATVPAIATEEHGMGDVAVLTGILSSSATPSKHDVLVLGLGNTLLGDDGVGVHVVRRLAGNPDVPPGLRMLDGGTLGFRLLAALTESHAVIVVDAAQLGEPAGCIRLLDQRALADHVNRGGRISAHEAGLVDLLTLAWLDGWAPVRLALLGIQPKFVDWCTQLSEPVERSVPQACQVVMRTVLAWQDAA
jgi:hydrogenase maturation protease